jgi:putative FmdB family regulatory protein
MPIYRYECMDCGAVFRVFHRDKNGGPVGCTHCNSQITRQLLPRIGVIYKGNGYYRTDYQNKKQTSSDKTKEKE